MQGPETLYFLMDAQGRSFYVEEGMVKTSATPRPLKFAPIGWDDFLVQFGRSSNLFMMDRSLTIPMEFVEDGAMILKDQYYRYGLEVQVDLLIAKQQLEIDETSYGFYYTTLYKGELDFSMYSHEGHKVVINAVEGNIKKYLDAYRNLKVEIPMDDLQTDMVLMDGLLLKQSAKYIITNGFLPNDNGNHSVNLTLVAQEGINLNIKGVDRVQLGDNPNQKLYDDQLWFYKASTSEPIKVKWNLRMTAQLAPGISPNPAVELYLDIRMMKPGSSLAHNRVILQQFTTPANVYRTNTFEGETTIDGFDEGDTLYLFMGINFIGASADRSVLFTYDPDYENTFEISEANYKHPPSYVRAVRPANLFKKLIEKITDGKYIPESPFLDSIPEYKITCGDAVRGLEGARIITSMEDFFKAFNSVFSAAMGVMKGVLRLEKRETSVQYTNVIPLGSVKKLVVKPTEDLFYSILEIGYANQEYDGVNGREEFNNTHVYKLPNTRVNKTLNLVSPYRADSIGIEFIRINMEGKTTVDNNADNSIIFLHTEKRAQPGPGSLFFYYKLNRDLNQYATGIVDQSVFNLDLSPKRCLLRNGSYIRSLFYKQDADWIRFQTTEKNSQLTVAVPGQPVIKENADVQLSELSAPLFIPIILEFETKVPANFVQELYNNPLSAFSFEYMGTTYKGIPENVAMNPENNESQVYQLYAAPDTDLTPLIDVFE